MILIAADIFMYIYIYIYCCLAGALFFAEVDSVSINESDFSKNTADQDEDLSGGSGGMLLY